MATSPSIGLLSLVHPGDAGRLAAALRTAEVITDRLGAAELATAAEAGTQCDASTLDALIYCPECRERGRFPWEHGADCVEALRQKVRWYETGLPWILLVLVAQTVLLIAVFVWLGRLP